MNDAAPTTLIERLRRIPAANIGDGMQRLGLLDSSVQAVWPGARVAGPAFTVWTRSGDNLFIHKAIDECNPGDVIVVNGHGDLSRALIGELIGARAAAKGIAGFVIDGAVRDAGGLQGYEMPVFARAITPAGPYKNGPGRLQVPIACAGVAVLPGDLIIGDSDGVAVVPRGMAEEVTDAAEAVQRDEAERRVTYESGIPAVARS